MCAGQADKQTFRHTKTHTLAYTQNLSGFTPAERGGMGVITRTAACQEKYHHCAVMCERIERRQKRVLYVSDLVSGL